MHPGPMNRGVEIDSDVADLPQAVIEEQVTNGIADPDVAALPVAGRRRRGGHSMAERDPVRRSARRRPASPAATRSRTCSSAASRSRRSGPVSPPTGPRRSTCAGLILAPGSRGPAHAPARAGLRAQGDDRDRHAGRGGRAATPRSRRWPTPIRSPTTRASWPRSARRPPPRGSCDVFPVGAITKGLAGESLAEIGEMVEAGVRVFSDDGNCVPTGAGAPQRADLREGVPRRGRDRRPLRGRLARARAARCTRAPNSYTLGLAGRPAEAEEIDRGARHRAGAAHRRPAPRLPRLVRRARSS